MLANRNIAMGPALLTETRSDGVVNTYVNPKGYFGVGSVLSVKGKRSETHPHAFVIYENTSYKGSSNYNPSGSFNTSWVGTFNQQVAFDPRTASWQSTCSTMAQQEALSRAYDKLRGGLDLAVDIAEARQVHRMVNASDKATAMFGLIARKAARVSRSKWDYTRALSSLWLEYRYGWKPLIKDIHESAVQLANHYRNFGFEVRGRAKVLDSLTLIGDWELDSTFTQTVSAKGSFRHQYVIRVCVPDNALTGAARFSSLNPVSIAWELMPYSFVADWFLNIGGAIRDLETAVAYQGYFRGGYQTQTSSMTYTGKAVRKPIKGADGKYEAEGYLKKLNRTLLTTMPWPNLPKVRCELGSIRLLNAAALLGMLLPKNKVISDQLYRNLRSRETKRKGLTDDLFKDLQRRKPKRKLTQDDWYG